MFSRPSSSASPPSQFTITREFVGSDDYTHELDSRRQHRAQQDDRPHGAWSGSSAEFHNGETRHQVKARLRGPRGGKVREDSESLSVTALGKPAKVIVLRDTQEAVEHEEKEEDEQAEKSSLRKTLLETIEQDDVPIDQDTVNQQLDAMRPRMEDPNSGRLMISEKEFFRLCKVITKSYSSIQLNLYIARSKATSSEEPAPRPLEAAKNHTADHSPDLQLRPWTQKPVHRSKRAKVLRHTVARASTILKKCWKVEVIEEVERLGELVCTLPKSGIRLLSAGKPSFLDEIAENRQAKLEIDGANIRVIADKASATYALEDINRLWSRHVVKVFPLARKCAPTRSPGAPITFRTEDVALVSSLTRTTMTYAIDSKRKAVAITGIGNESVDDAFRALLALIDTPSRSVSIKERMVHTIAGPADAVMQDVSDLEALPYRDRSSSYGRLCAPTTRKILPQPQPELHSQDSSDRFPALEIDSAVDHSVVAEVTAMAGQGRWLQLIASDITNPITSEPPAWAKFWTTQTGPTISVHLGSVIHAKGSDSAVERTHAPRLSTHAKFLHGVPGFSSLLPHLSWDRKHLTNILSFRLLHDPWRSSGRPRPDLHLDFEVKSDATPFGETQKKIDFKGLYAITRDRRNLVMLPSQAVDICFKKEEVYHATDAYFSTQPDVTAFIEQTKANIVAGLGILRAPANVRLRLPFPITAHRKKNASKKTKKSPSASDSPEAANDAGVLADYYFSGVEHKQVAGYTFKGCPVRYTSVEGGKFGGKYGNLEIFMPQIEESKDGDDKNSQREVFVQSVLNLVGLVDKAAQGRLERPGRRVSEDENEGQEIDIDQADLEQWTPEHLMPKSSQPAATPKSEEEVQRAEHELSGLAGHHANISTGLQENELAQFDASTTVSPVALLDGSAQSTEVAPDERLPDQTTFTQTIEVEEIDTPRPAQRSAASG
ncbi:hypothetical protein FKW77_003502 [Venturia effusa]|uniref:Uncharacterized protein n=1 Tax=Venturia effusa TaxID=50376 RepID=A0A517LDK2_9PEZI|nr:hypothetical protein FKW77_003502 [Venturia effusa]